MKYVIDIPKNLMEKARVILSKGEYSNINELMVTALENQIILEMGERIEEDLFSAVIKVPKISRYNSSKKTNGSDFRDWLSINESLSLNTLSMPEVKDLEYKESEYEKSWLWGQINRIFPIKVGLRILANMEFNRNDRIPVLELHEKACKIARDFGLHLKTIDKQLNRKRDECVSTGLPFGENEEKSLSRFSGHFLAFRRMDNILDGGLIRLKFVNIQAQENGDDLIGLTEQGLKFVNLKNHILDENENLEKTLSEDEVVFYLNHVRKNVPEELNPFLHILKVLYTGPSSINDIDNEIKALKPKWTDTLVTTIRSGALGRMFELGLLRKIKKGIYVKYEISDRGKGFIDKIRSN